MSNLWLKVKIWTKGVLVGIVTIYLLLFIFNNLNKKADFWFWFGQEPKTPLLLLVFLCLAVGILGTLLVRTLLGTMRQIREMRVRGRTERLEREVQEMKSKASMIRTRPEGAPAPSAAPTSSTSGSSGVNKV